MGIFGDDDASESIKQAGEDYQEYLQKALAELQEAWKQGRLDITGYASPYISAGKQGLQAYLATLGLSGGGEQQAAADRFRMTPGYQFALRQGLDAITSANAAKGMTGSGAAARALQQYGQGMAEQQYGAYQSQLAGLAGMGQRTAMQTGQELGQLGYGYAGQIAGTYGTMGRAKAESEMAAARAEAAESSGILGGIGSLVGAGIGAYFGGPQGAMAGGQIGGGVGRLAAGGQGWSAFGGQQQQQGGGFGGFPMMGAFGGQQQQQSGGFGSFPMMGFMSGGTSGGMWRGMLPMFGGMFGQNTYNPSYGMPWQNQNSWWGSNVWRNPDTGQLVPVS